jgi:hypothetical protein
VSHTRGPRGTVAKNDDDRSGDQARSMFFTHRSVSTFDRFPFQLTDELFLYGMALTLQS